jgi:hypothetical protein
LTDNEEQERVPESDFDQLLVNGRDEGAFNGTRFLYQRGPEPSLITIRLLRCPTADEREGCPPDSDGGCCARAMLAAQQDFREQKGQLEEELVAANQLCIFYPKFHCEMNFIERFWCGAKWYSRENCSYSFEGLRAAVPKALDSVTTASIHRHYKHCERIIEAYSDGMTYGTEEFTKRVYKGHRQVADKSKW